MNFQTMSKQRKFVLIAAAVGIIGIFCPWVTLFGFNVNGFRGVGILIFICLLAAVVLALMGDQTKNLDKTNWMIILIASALAAIIMVINLFDAQLEFMSFGFYMTLLGTLGTLAAVFIFRSPDDNIKDGFDSLKKDFGNKMGNTGTTNTTGNNRGPVNPDNTNPPL
jgi:peptidoglycan/LPS O-acetylase OafA/YrhL